MNTSGTFTQQLLDKEMEGWRNLTPADYDRTLCDLLDSINTSSPPLEKDEALLTLASRTLRRNSPTLTESRARYAEQLVTMGIDVSESAQRLRIHLLFLLAWLHLGAVAERGPEYIEMTPHLPEGVVLPTGTDPDEIDDPILQEQARGEVRRHRERIDRWNAKQSALENLNTLANHMRDARPRFVGGEDEWQELLTAMSLAPGLPPELIQMLEDEIK